MTPYASIHRLLAVYKANLIKGYTRGIHSYHYAELEKKKIPCKIN
jgi:hypothetical protein